MTRWTDEQLAAIEWRDSNILVAAGAGAGKTAVLVERIVSLLTDPVRPLDVDRLLVVTFTNAAASEMRQRIASTLADRLDRSPDDLHLRRQLALMGKASIMTLHSFCLGLLRQYFYHLDLDPAFRVADESEAGIISADVVTAVLEDRYRDADEAFMQLVESMGLQPDDRRLSDAILGLAAYARSTPDPAAWLAGLSEPFFRGAAATGSQGLAAIVLNFVRAELGIALSHLKSAIIFAGQTGGPQHYLPRLAEDAAALEGAILRADMGWDELREALASIPFGRLPSRRDTDESLRESARTRRSRARDMVRKILGGPMRQSARELEQGMSTAAPMVECLASLCHDFLSRLAAVKRERNLVDFGDLEHLALDLLYEDGGGVSHIARSLQGQFTEVLVDEYQDINGLQETIIAAVAGPGRLFMVGDVKQSIYRFRLADPLLFVDKYRRYSATETGRVVDLSVNFRSRSHVLGAVNGLFRHIMRRSVAEIDYDAAAELKGGADFPHAPCPSPPEKAQLVILESGTEEEAGEEREESAVLEARYVAGEIQRLMAGGYLTYDGGSDQYRPLCFRDIAVLLRATRQWADVFAREMALLGVPSSGDTRGSYFAAIEVSTMLSLLRIIDNPRQDIPLAAVLRSPIASFRGSELAQIRLADTNDSLWQALLACSRQNTDIGSRAAAFIAALEEWRTYARQKSLPELVWRLFQDTGYDIYLGATPRGESRQSNLHALYQQACQFEQTSFRGLSRFLRFVERLEDNGQDLTSRASRESSNAVQIMSVHKSKGLEFPVVFLAGLGRAFNKTDLRREVLMHRDLGVGPHAVDLAVRQRYPSLARMALEIRLNQELAAEEMRVLYVAMTRAREHLVLIGSQRNRDERIAFWRDGCREELLADPVLLSARTPLEWIAPVALCEQGGGDFYAVDLPDSNPNGTGLSAAPEKPEGHDSDQPDSDLAASVRHRLSWRYPHSQIATLPAKATVSALKSRSEEAKDYLFEPLPAKPSSLAAPSSPFSAAMRGTLTHVLLQQADLRQAHDIPYLRRLILSLVQRDLVSKEDAAQIDIGAVASFFARPLGMRLAAAARVWRELPFSMLMPAEEVYTGAAAGEAVLLHGIVDCLFAEGDRLVLLDFKTDRSTAHVGRYSQQVGYYRRAVEQITGKRVSEIWLSFLSLNMDFSVGTQ